MSSPVLFLISDEPRTMSLHPFPLPFHTSPFDPFSEAAMICPAACFLSIPQPFDRFPWCRKPLICLFFFVDMSFCIGCLFPPASPFFLAAPARAIPHPFSASKYKFSSPMLQSSSANSMLCLTMIFIIAHCVCRRQRAHDFPATPFCPFFFRIQFYFGVRLTPIPPPFRSNAKPLNFSLSDRLNLSVSPLELSRTPFSPPTQSSHFVCTSLDC